MARTALALNWWNPLAWISWREFLKERERATDDLVLSAGARASEYASHLLEVARAMHTAPVSACAAVPWHGLRSWKGVCSRSSIRGPTANRFAPPRRLWSR